MLGEQQPDYAESLDNLALLYQTTARYAEAEPLYRQAAEIWRAVLGEQHPDYATSLNNLAALYEATGRYAESEPLYKQAAEIRRNILGTQHPDYAACLNNLAGLYRPPGVTQMPNRSINRQPKSAARHSASSTKITPKASTT